MFFGFHSVYEDSFYEGIDKAASGGFRFVQFDLGVPSFGLYNLPETEALKIKNYAEDRNIGITLHGPCDNISFFCEQPAVKKGITEHYAAVIRSAERLGARHLTLHLGAYPSYKMSADGERREEYNDTVQKRLNFFANTLCENIGELVKRTNSVMLCVENTGFDGFTMLCVERLLDEYGILNLTLDIAKLYDGQMRADEKQADFFYKHYDRVREVHIHDGIAGKGKHQTVGSGSVDFIRFRDFCLKPDVYCTVEVRPFEAALRSKAIIQKLLA
ncbi:MAG: sugar phosphate isomerase/epimerase [Clostridiales bacterium]|jgi:sugar phosphate isomerase/epimerase|nr:sugar phosphate isomerase/epimerase [Clostridiales bacterium]